MTPSELEAIRERCEAARTYPLHNRRHSLIDGRPAPGEGPCAACEFENHAKEDVLSLLSYTAKLETSIIEKENEVNDTIRTIGGIVAGQKLFSIAADQIIQIQKKHIASLEADLKAMARATLAVREDFGGWWWSSPDSEPLGQLRMAFDSPGVQAVLYTAEREQ